VQTVRRIYRLYLRDEGTYSGIARLLNSEGLPAEGGGTWSIARVREVLTNPKYVGRLISGRWRHELGGSSKRMPPGTWLQVDDALQPLVALKDFNRVQRKIRSRRERVTEGEALADLKRILAERGNLSEHMIKKHGRWSFALYQRRLGSLREIYALLGYRASPEESARRQAFLERCVANRPPPKHSFASVIPALEALWARKGYLSQRLVNDEPSLPHASVLQRRFGGLRRLYDLIGYTPTPRQMVGLRSPCRDRSV
jgi:hypothetical protein